MLAPFGLVDLECDLERSRRSSTSGSAAAAAFRADGQLQAWDAGFVVPRYGPEVVDELVAGSRRSASRNATAVIRLNRVLTTFLFLLYFDTRAGYQDARSSLSR